MLHIPIDMLLKLEGFIAGNFQENVKKPSFLWKKYLKNNHRNQHNFSTPTFPSPTTTRGDSHFSILFNPYYFIQCIEV
jgi:hypothetical protein